MTDLLLALAIPLAACLGAWWGAGEAELGRRLIRLREFDPREHLAAAWQEGYEASAGDVFATDNPYLACEDDR